MDNESVFDELEKNTNIDLHLITERKRYLIRILVLIIINTILFALFIKGRDFVDNLLAILSIVLVYFIARKFFDQFTSLLCALLFSLMPVFSENGLFLEYFSVFFCVSGNFHYRLIFFKM